MELRRREILKGLGSGAVGLGLSRPALAQAAPTVTWRLASSFVSGLDLIYGGGETFAAALAELTDGNFKISNCPCRGASACARDT